MVFRSRIGSRFSLRKVEVLGEGFLLVLTNKKKENNMKVIKI